MHPLHTTLTHYLDVRRALGFNLQETGTLLHQCVHFVHQEGAPYITTDLALRWATQPQRTHPAHWARRLGMVRRFAPYCRALDTRTEVPPHGLLPYRYRRQPPYMYSEQEITRRLAAARRLPSVPGRRSCPYATLLGLRAVTGMRLSAALHLDRTDVERTHGHLTMRQTKLGKTRWLPLHPSTRDALHPYARCRDQRWPTPHTPRFFLSARGTPLTVWSVRQTVVTLAHQIGLRGATDRYGPRRHDLRHTCAVRTLLAWYRTGVNGEPRLPTLTASLGHTHVNDTSWYLSATPELFYEVPQRFETHLKADHHAD